MRVSSTVLSGCDAVSGLAWSAGSLTVDPGCLAIGGVELDALLAAGAFVICPAALRYVVPAELALALAELFRA